MEESTFSFTAADGAEITAYRWTGDGPPRAIVQIAHGMGEHAGRYRRLAEALTAAGYVVYANDHRGHGRTAASTDAQGDLGPGGWAGLVSDIGELSALARREHPALRLVVLGHSMGSFALQQHLLDHSDELDGAVLSGTTAFDIVAPGIDPTKETDLERVQRALRAGPHGLRLAQPRPGRGRCLRRRSGVRLRARRDGDGGHARGAPAHR